MTRALLPKLALSTASLDSVSIKEKIRTLSAAAASKKRKSRDSDSQAQAELATSILDDIGGSTAEPSCDSSENGQPATLLSISGLLHPALVRDIRLQTQ